MNLQNVGINLEWNNYSGNYPKIKDKIEVSLLKKIQVWDFIRYTSIWLTSKWMRMKQLDKLFYRSV